MCTVHKEACMAYLETVVDEEAVEGTVKKEIPQCFMLSLFQFVP